MPSDVSAARVAGLMERLIGQAIPFNEQVAQTFGISAVDLQAELFGAA